MDNPSGVGVIDRSIKILERLEEGPPHCSSWLKPLGSHGRPCTGWPPRSCTIAWCHAMTRPDTS